MNTASNRRLRSAALAGAAALAVVLTGACNDASPADDPGNQQDDGGDERDGGGY